MPRAATITAIAVSSLLFAADRAPAQEIRPSDPLRIRTQEINPTPPGQTPPGQTPPGVPPGTQPTPVIGPDGKPFVAPKPPPPSQTRIPGAFDTSIIPTGAPRFTFTPSITLSEQWTDNFFLTDRGRTVTGRVFVDERGAPYDFSTTDRYADLPGGMVQAEWRTPVRGWQVIDGRAVPGAIEAVWHLPDGPMPYFTGQFGCLTRNVPPG